MSGAVQQRTPVAFRVYGLNPGETPQVQIDYNDGTTVVFGHNDPAAEQLVAEALSGPD